MANVTDPLACAVHGTNPQNLIEYITRQRIYDSHFWKEECFGLNAVDVAEKAATRVFAVGGCYGGNRQPTRFLSLLLKLLQIQPAEEIVDELIQNEDFGYVRLLGATYLRLTGRPADIYEKLEPLYLDYRRARYRTVTGWKTVCVDEYIQELLRNDRICDIMLPRIPKRTVLEENGYLEGPRISPMHVHLDDVPDKIKAIQNLLLQMANDGCDSAKNAVETLHLLDQQEVNPASDDDENIHEEKSTLAFDTPKPSESNTKDHSNDESSIEHRHRKSSRRSWGRRDDDDGDDDYQNERRQLHPLGRRKDERGYRRREYDPSSRKDSRKDQYDDSSDRGHSREMKNEDDHHRSRSKHIDDQDDKQYENRHKKSKKEKSRKHERKKHKSKDESYGSLFKKSNTKSEEKILPKEEPMDKRDNDEKDEEYWNAERAKLGLKPLRK